MQKGPVSSALFVVLGGAILSLALSGCTDQPRALRDEPPASTDAAQIIARYNDNAMRVERISATARASVRYPDPDSGKMRREQGDGRFVFVRPDRVTLTVGKLGHDLIWAGNNDRAFWLFDLQDDGVAYVGTYERLDSPGAQPLPLPIRPDRLPSLLGLIPVGAEEAYSEWHEGSLLVEPASDSRRLLLDSRTGLARRIDLLDAAGRSTVICELTGEKTLRPRAGGKAIVLPQTVTIRVVGEAGDLTLKLDDFTDDPDKFNPRQFDLDVLMQRHKPGKTVNLDGA